MSTTDRAAADISIVLTGGGTGGHITPILAVAHELKLQRPEVKTVYIGETGGKFKELTEQNQDIDATFTIRAGKLRRYHGESMLTRLLDVKTIALNIRDLFYLVIGVFQAWWRLGRIKPKVVFLKGGFVGVPVGLAAAMRGIPIVTHDSDAIPGLANRLVSRWVTVHATAMPAEIYAYPTDKVSHVGVLVEHTYEFITPALKETYREKLSLPKRGRILLITGGSSGAERLNEAIRQIVPSLLDTYEDLTVIHQVGKGKLATYQGYQHDRLQVLEFLHPMFRFMGTADVVVARASANTIAELGVQGKAAIVVPSPFLAGGHQLENAKLLEKSGVAWVVQEGDMLNESNGLQSKISQLLDNERKRIQLANLMHMQAIPDAAKRLAMVLLEQIHV